MFEDDGPKDFPLEYQVLVRCRVAGGRRWFVRGHLCSLVARSVAVGLQEVRENSVDLEGNASPRKREGYM